jgi:hypothetical protein
MWTLAVFVSSRIEPSGARVRNMGPPGGDEQAARPANTSEQRRYVEQLHARIRVGNAASMLRTGGIRTLWIIVVVAGAGVPLNEAIGGPVWFGPALGFVVVVAAGIERIFGRTTPAAAAQDLLRRGLARERRLFLSGAAAYGASNAFDLYAERSEQ